MSQKPQRLIFSALLIALLSSAPQARVKPKAVYDIKWREQAGRIVMTSVCARFRRGSLDYRQCRSFALDHFTRLCEHHRQKLHSSGGQARERHRTLSRKYCSAARKLP